MTAANDERVSEGQARLPEPSADVNAHTRARVIEFEGLRALLALWVLVYHVFTITLRPVPPILAGGHSVGVFFALSGYVIALLLMKSEERYFPFIVRRLFRLFPAYAICVLASGALTAVKLMPQHFESSDLPLHVLLHATMLHGSVPTDWLTGSAGAFLNPAWSVSVEWQFYLVIPAFFALRRARPILAWLGLLALAGVAHRVAGAFGAGSLLQQAHFFATGIACYYVHAWTQQHPAAARPFLPLMPYAPFLLLLPIVPLGQNFGMLLWLVCFGVAVSANGGHALAPTRWFARFLRAPRLVSLGAASYALYLVHEPFVWLARYGLEAMLPSLHGLALTAAVGALSLPVSLLAAKLLHELVEVPCIRLGKRVTNRAA